MAGAGSVAVCPQEGAHRHLMTDSSCSQSVHKGSKWLGTGSATQLTSRAGTQGTHIAFVSPKSFTFHPSQQDSTGWRMQKVWETLQWGAGGCHRNNTSEPQPEEPVGRGVVVSLCLSCAGGCSSFPAALQLGIALVSWAAGRKCGCHGTGPFVSYRNTADEERDWILCAAGGQLNCTILAN